MMSASVRKKRTLIDAIEESERCRYRQPAGLHEFTEPDQCDLPGPPPLTKIFPFSPEPNQFRNPAVLSPNEGRIAIVTDVGMGRGSVGRVDVIAGRVLGL